MRHCPSKDPLGWRILTLPKCLRAALAAVLIFAPCCAVFSADVRELVDPPVIRITPEGQRAAEQHGVGAWIWATNRFTDKQTCRVWRSFTLPETNRVKSATIKITADNVYRLYLDGREIGEGGNWKTLTEYDVTFLLNPGKHVLAIEAFNDSLEGGILAGLKIRFMNGAEKKILSDESWLVIPNDVSRWQHRKKPGPDWPHARVVGVVGSFPWWLNPVDTIQTAPLRPPELRFWQNGWFLAVLFSILFVALALSVQLAARLAVQIRAQKLLEQERVRIARDIHDDLGSALTQLVLQGEVAQTEFPEHSKERLRFGEFCDKARSASHALDEVVWAVNSKRDTLRDFSSYLCKHAQNFLTSSHIRCRLDVQPGIPATLFDLPVRRGLLLAVKEALNNVAKHSGASEAFIHVFQQGERAVVIVEDNGRGFDMDALSGDRNGLNNMQQRLQDLGGMCRIASTPGTGTRVEFQMPLTHPASRTRFSFRRLFARSPRESRETGEDSLHQKHGYSES